VPRKIFASMATCKNVEVAPRKPKPIHHPATPERTDARADVRAADRVESGVAPSERNVPCFLAEAAP
jgi:hypothetical protein